MLTLKSLFENDFCVEIGFDGHKATQVAQLFKDALEKGVKYTLSETLTNTWMAGQGDNTFNYDNWGYFGILDGETFVEDSVWGTHSLSVEQFSNIVNMSDNVNQGISTTIDGNLVISGGVVVVTYKSGKQYHLEHNGKATLDSIKRIVTTERTFMKDGQEAYERVIVDLDSLDSIQSDTNKLINMGNNQVAFVTLFNL